MTREQKIERMLEADGEVLLDTKHNDLVEMLIEIYHDGFKGYANMTDVEIDERFTQYEEMY